MKTAIYIEDGVVQLVITPETEFEKNAMTTLMDTDIDAQIFSGSFYDCRGEWTAETMEDAREMAIAFNEGVS